MRTAACGLLIILAAFADANPRRVVRSCNQVVVVEQIRTELATTFVPINVPAYPVGYGHSQDFTLLLEELRLLRQEVASMRQGQAARSTTEPSYISLIRQNCAACHGINPKGNKLSMFTKDNLWIEPTPELLGDMIAMISSGKMPKERKMASEDRLALIAGLSTAPEQLKSSPKEKSP